MQIRLTENQELVADEQAFTWLKRDGIGHGLWPSVTRLDASLCRHSAKDSELQSQIIADLQSELTTLKNEYGYVTEDVVSLSKETPNLEALLDKFRPVHHHTDDEVRVILAGAGIFGIEPVEGPSYEVHMEPGDWIVVPAFTRHWFDLTSDRFVVALRVFKDQSGWQAIYEPVTSAVRV